MDRTQKSGKVRNVATREDTQRMRELAAAGLKQNRLGAISCVVGYCLLVAAICASSYSKAARDSSSVGGAAPETPSGLLAMVQSSVLPTFGSKAGTCQATSNAAPDFPPVPILHWCAFAIYAALSAMEGLAFGFSAQVTRRRSGVITLARCVILATSYFVTALGITPSSAPVFGSSLIEPTRQLGWTVASSMAIYIVWSSGTKEQPFLIRSLALNAALHISRLLPVVSSSDALHFAALGVAVISSAALSYHAWAMLSSIPSTCPETEETSLEGDISSHAQLCYAARVGVFATWIFFYGINIMQFFLLPRLGIALAVLVADVAMTAMLSAGVQLGVFVAIQDQKLEAIILMGPSIMHDLKEQEVRKDRFFAAMTHELRTPLNGIVGLTEALMMTKKCDIPEKIATTISTVHDSGRRLQQLINNILDSASVSESKLRIVIEPMQIQKLLDEVPVLIRPILRPGVKLIIKTQSDLPHINADYQRLSQVLYNILGNAAKFTESGEIIVKTTCVDGMICMKVKDSGMGIPYDKQGQIFKPFEQIDSGSTRLYGGTGLGLSLAQSIVESHDGKLTVQSEVGEGSTFIIRLPVDSAVAEKDAQIVSSWKVQNSPHDGNITKPLKRNASRLDMALSEGTTETYESPLHASPNKPEASACNRRSMESTSSGITNFSENSEHEEQTNSALQSWLKNISATSSQVALNLTEDGNTKLPEIMCVDDEMVNQIVITELLESSGFKVTSAMSAHEALDILSKRHAEKGVKAFPSLILMDLMMPGMTGLEATSMIRSTYQETTMPIIMLSANDDEASVCTALETGCNDYVHKPFKAAELLARVGLQTSKQNASLSGESNGGAIMQEFMPSSVIERLKSGDDCIDSFDTLTVVICDIVDFPGIMARASPKAIIKMLNDYISRLDGLLDKHGMFRLDPVGSVYMAVCGFSKTCAKDVAPEVRAVRFAKSVLDTSTRIEAPSGEALSVRVMVNTGPAIAGIIGAKIPRYSFYGQTLDIYGLCRGPVDSPAGCVHISDATHDSIQASNNSEFNFHELNPTKNAPRRGPSSLHMKGFSPDKSKEASLRGWLLGYGNHFESALAAHNKRLLGFSKRQSSVSSLRSTTAQVQDVVATAVTTEDRVSQMEVPTANGVASGEKRTQDVLDQHSIKRSNSWFSCIGPPPQDMEV